MSSPNKSTGEEVDHKEDNGEHEEQRNPDSPLKSDQSGLSDDLESDGSDDSDLHSKNTLSPKRQSGLISGERNNLEDSPSTAKKPKQDVSPQRQKRNSTSGENDSSGGLTLKKAKEAADSTPVSPSSVPSPKESPSTPQQSPLSPVKRTNSPILQKLLQQGSNVSPMSGLSAVTESITGNLTRPLPTDSDTQSQVNSPLNHPAIVDLLTRPPILPGTEGIAENPHESLPTESVTQPQGNSSGTPTIESLLSQPPIIPPPPSLAAAIGTKISNPEEKADARDIKKSPFVKSDPLSCGAQGSSDFDIPSQTSGHRNATEPMNEPVSDPPTETKGESAKKEVHPSEESSPEKVKFEETTKDVNISSQPPSSSSSAVTAPEPEIPSSQPTAMNTPPESSEVSMDDSISKNSKTSDRLQKMSDNLKGIKLEDSSKSTTQSRQSKRLQETKKSSGDDTSAPEDEGFKRPSVISIQKPKIRNRVDETNLESRDVGSPIRRSARIQSSKESGSSSKESGSLQKEKNLRSKPGGRAASDERTEESGKSKSLSRERTAKLKTESGSRERVKTEGETSRTRSREGTPKPKKRDTSPSGSRERTASGEGVARRTRSNQSRTASSNSEADKTEEDESEPPKDKRKSRKDSSK